MMNDNSFDPNAFGEDTQKQVNNPSAQNTEPYNQTYPPNDPNSYYTDYRGQPTVQPMQNTNPMQPMVQPAHGSALAALICGIVGLLCCGIPLGITAIILSTLAKKQGNTEGIATAGLVLGILALVGAVISIIITPILSAYLADLMNQLTNNPEFTTIFFK